MELVKKLFLKSITGIPMVIVSSYLINLSLLLAGYQYPLYTNELLLGLLFLIACVFKYCLYYKIVIIYLASCNYILLWFPYNGCILLLLVILICLIIYYFLFKNEYTREVFSKIIRRSKLEYKNWQLQYWRRGIV
jgi:hypothetical protein